MTGRNDIYKEHLASLGIENLLDFAEPFQAIHDMYEAGNELAPNDPYRNLQMGTMTWMAKLAVEQAKALLPNGTVGKWRQLALDLDKLIAIEASYISGCTQTILILEQEGRIGTEIVDSYAAEIANHERTAWYLAAGKVG